MYKDAIYVIITTQSFEEGRELSKRKNLIFSSNYGDFYLN